MLDHMVTRKPLQTCSEPATLALAKSSPALVVYSLWYNYAHMHLAFAMFPHVLFDSQYSANILIFSETLLSGETTERNSTLPLFTACSIISLATLGRPFDLGFLWYSGKPVDCNSCKDIEDNKDPKDAKVEPPAIITDVHSG